MRDRRKSDTQVLLLQQKLMSHIEDYQRHCEESDKRWGHLLAAQERNTDSITDLTESTRALADSTRDIVLAWDSANGAVRTVGVISKVVKWIGGISIAGVSVSWLLEKLQG